MIDFHSHILPRMDDGSKSIEESLEMLRRLAAQGITKVVATPHFYANDESVAEFLERRKQSYNSLMPHITEDMPEILLGAEVKYYQGISRLEDLKALCIEGSDLLLLEMPMCKWTEYTVKEVVDITGFGNIIVVMAHVERYMNFQSKKIWNQLLECDLLMQVNADFFTELHTRRKALKMIMDQTVQLIGSDTHNLTARCPRMGEAFEIIRKKHGEGFVRHINHYENALFSR